MVKLPFCFFKFLEPISLAENDAIRLLQTKKILIPTRGSFYDANVQSTGQSYKFIPGLILTEKQFHSGQKEKVTLSLKLTISSVGL
jgi:hypothetical protein